MRISLGPVGLPALTGQIPKNILQEKTKSPEVSSEGPQNKVHFVANRRTRNRFSSNGKNQGALWHF